MARYQGPSKAEHFRFSIEPKGKLLVDGSYNVENHNYSFHSIPLDTTLVRSPTEEYPGTKLEDLKLDNSYRCYHWRGGDARVAGFCYSAFAEPLTEASFDEKGHRFGMRYRAWRPEGKNASGPEIHLRIPVTPGANVSWIAVRYLDSPNGQPPSCKGCVTHLADAPTAFEVLSGWHLFAVIPGQAIEILVKLEPKFQTDLIRHLKNPNILRLAKDQMSSVSVLELTAKVRAKLGVMDIFKIAETTPDFPVLRYVANLPSEDDSKLDIQERVIQRLATLNKMAELALAEDQFGSVDPKKIQEEESRRTIYAFKPEEEWKPRWAEELPQAPVQERRQALAAGILLEAYRSHQRYVPLLKREIETAQNKLQGTKLEAAEAKSRIVGLCLAFRALQYEANSGPVHGFTPDSEVLKLCGEYLGQ